MLTHTFPIIHSLLTGAVMLDGILYTTSTLSLSLMQADSFLSNSISMELLEPFLIFILKTLWQINMYWVVYLASA